MATDPLVDPPRAWVRRAGRSAPPRRERSRRGPSRPDAPAQTPAGELLQPGRSTGDTRHDERSEQRPVREQEREGRPGGGQKYVPPREAEGQREEHEQGATRPEHSERLHARL